MSACNPAQSEKDSKLVAFAGTPAPITLAPVRNKDNVAHQKGVMRMILRRDAELFQSLASK